MSTATKQPVKFSIEDALGTVQKKTTERYREVINDLAREKAVSAEDIQSAMIGAGKSTDDLRADIDIVKARIEASKQATEAEKLLANREAERAEAQRLTEAAASVRAECEARIQAAEAAARAANDLAAANSHQATHLAREARQTFSQTAAPELVQQLRALERERSDIGTRRADLEREIGEVSGIVSRHDLALAKPIEGRSRDERLWSTTHVAGLSARLPALKESLARMNARAIEVDREIDQLKAKIADPLAGW